MTGKPDDIPQEVWDMATNMRVSLEAIARAIMAERKRCLEITNAWLICFGERGDELKFTSPQEWANGAVEDIAEMISSGRTIPSATRKPAA
jgi:hypothetical protein